jgi:hypothetical protein
MKKISWKDFLIGVLVAVVFFAIIGATTKDNSPGRYMVAVGGGNDTYSVCVTDTWTGETRCQQGGGPKTHSFSPDF